MDQTKNWGSVLQVSPFMPEYYTWQFQPENAKPVLMQILLVMCRCPMDSIKILFLAHRSILAGIQIYSLRQLIACSLRRIFDSEECVA